MNQDFIKFLKHYRGILITLLILLCIKLFNKICSLFRKSDKGESRDEINLTIKRAHDSFAERVYALANGYRRENTSSIFRAILWMIKMGRNYIHKGDFADGDDPQGIITKGKEKQYYTVEAIPAAADWIIKKAISIAAIGFAWFSLYECFKNINPHEKLGINLVHENLQSVGALVVISIILAIISIIFVANRVIDGMNLFAVNLREVDGKKLYTRHVGEFVVDKISSLYNDWKESKSSYKSI